MHRCPKSVFEYQLVERLRHRNAGLGRAHMLGEAAEFRSNHWQTVHDCFEKCLSGGVLPRRVNQKVGGGHDLRNIVAIAQKANSFADASPRDPWPTSPSLNGI